MTNLVQNIAKNNSSGFPLGNIVSYSATPVNKAFQKAEYKKQKNELKKRIGKKVHSVGYCGIKPIKAYSQFVDVVSGEKGGTYYQGMQHCGSVWFCPDCMYKITKTRANELYNQLLSYKNEGKTILFITFTLQHHKGQRLSYLHKKLIEAFNFANSHRSWIKVKKEYQIEFLRTLEVLFGENGWHPHLHSVFVGSPEIIKAINIFLELYKNQLANSGLVTNKHTVDMELWNGKLTDMKDYIFKGLLEQELFGNIKKSGKGKTFFELVKEGNETAQNEYIEVMKGKRQYHHSRSFFGKVPIKTDEEILKDDKVEKVLFRIPMEVYKDIVLKGIALHLLNQYEYGGKALAIKLLELYDVDVGFLD